MQRHLSDSRRGKNVRLPKSDLLRRLMGAWALGVRFAPLVHVSINAVMSRKKCLGGFAQSGCGHPARGQERISGRLDSERVGPISNAT